MNTKIKFLAILVIITMLGIGLMSIQPIKTSPMAIINEIQSLRTNAVRTDTFHGYAACFPGQVADIRADITMDTEWHFNKTYNIHLKIYVVDLVNFQWINITGDGMLNDFYFNYKEFVGSNYYSLINITIPDRKIIISEGGSWEKDFQLTTNITMGGELAVVDLTTWFTLKNGTGYDSNGFIVGNMLLMPPFEETSLLMALLLLLTPSPPNIILPIVIGAIVGAVVVVVVVVIVVKKRK